MLSVSQDQPIAWQKSVTGKVEQWNASTQKPKISIQQSDGLFSTYNSKCTNETSWPLACEEETKWTV